MVKRLLTIALGLALASSLVAQTAPKTVTINESDIRDNYNFTGASNLIDAGNPSGGTPKLPDTVDASIAFGDILYWVGTGTDSAVFIVNYAQPDTAFAWGYLFNSSTTAQAMVAAIAAADPRFWVEGDPSTSGDLRFLTDEGDTLGLSPVDPDMGYNFWWTNLNGVSAGAGAASTLHNGDVFKYGDMNSATGWSYMYGYYLEEAWNTTPTPVPAPGDPAPVEATIAFSDIAYWVGTGSNEAVLAVNWADTALAWGYRWDGTATVAAMMDDIAAADPRFSYTMDGGYLGDILFVETAGDTLRGTSWWECSLYNGMSQVLADGDLAKWADPAAGVVVDSMEYGGVYYYTYAYPMTIHAVSQPLGAGPFCGIVGTDGCTAIPANSTAIKGWATACTVELGPENISVEGSPLVSYHSAQDAVGPCTMNDNLSVVALGDGGSATVTFDLPIMNGEGPDFAVFENSFNDYFLELAFVEVSSDGEHFVRFPSTSLTQTVRQVVNSIDATYINNLAGKYRMGYGTPFDLEELRDSASLDLNNITHVRIVDVVGSIDPQYATYDAFGHIVNDPWPTNSYSTGFDLDGVAVINQSTNAIDEAAADAAEVSFWPNPTTDRMNISVASASEARLMDINGSTVATFTLHAGSNTFSIASLPAGVYMLSVDGSVKKVVKL